MMRLHERTSSEPHTRAAGTPGCALKRVMRTIVGHPQWCLCLLLAWGALALEPRHTTAWKIYETVIGGSAYIGLNNGNTVQLNTNTKLRTPVVAPIRTVTVDRGEAFFHVGSRTLRVLVQHIAIGGTNASFSVRDYGNGNVDVVSLDGSVHIYPMRSTHESGGLSAQPVDQIVSAGQFARVRPDKVSLYKLESSSIQRKLMWRSGMLELVNVKLEDAAAEFNRYNVTRLTVDDPVLACRRIGGRFSVSDLAGFVATVSRILEARAQTSQTSSGAVIHLKRTAGRATETVPPCARKIPSAD